MYVGFIFVYPFIFQVFLVLNVFSGHILCLLGLPLIAAIRALPPPASSTKSLTVIPSPDVLFHPLSLLLGLFTLRLALTMINATLQRRHLMVWAIFAPKYVFDGIALLCLDPLALFVVYALSY
jgi:phosphatidylinositol glycan class O